MPAGVSNARYFKFAFAAMFSMFLGSQIVHITYRPLEGLDKTIEEEKKALLKELADLKEEKPKTDSGGV